ncbi:MAG TPA: hypothetical protein VFO54_04595 [Chryseosolibacter sp.]|nr:hypothetical protein [Chryseosolibacter sp.]
MKRIILYGMISLISLSLIPTQTHANVPPSSMNSEKGEVPAEARILLVRLDEIKAMDRSTLTSSEKKELRREVRSIKKELKTMNQGVYLSVGAIIIIVLLLILLL